MSHLLALDQGTSSSRSIVFHRDGRVIAMAQRELPQHYPQSGWVEHDPLRIWSDQIATAREALALAQRDHGVGADQISGVGLTNQRETTVVWRRDTGEPVHRAIVWQDRRSESVCARWRVDGLEALVRERTGLVIDAYFSGPKLAWMFEHLDGLRAQAERGELAFGTVDSWLLWRLTGGRVHATDVTNASRTMLFNIHTQQWDTGLLRTLGIPASILPQVHPSSHLFGTTTADSLGLHLPVGGIAGDQQSALFGQACFEPGLVKNTYGTGCFMLMPVTAQAQASAASGLLTTSAAETSALSQGQARLALEGSVFVGGAVVQWLRDGLGAIGRSEDVEALAAQVPDSGGVHFVPAFTGLGAPYWNPHARGAIVGLSRGSTTAHIARAALESIAFQSAALLQAMSAEAERGGSPRPRELRVDGGACRNDLLMQMQANLLGLPVVRPEITETTALGAAYLAGLATGVYRDTAEIAAQWRVQRRFVPEMAPEQAQARMAEWAHAVRQTVAA